MTKEEILKEKVSPFILKRDCKNILSAMQAYCDQEVAKLKIDHEKEVKEAFEAADKMVNWHWSMAEFSTDDPSPEYSNFEEWIAIKRGAPKALGDNSEEHF